MADDTAELLALADKHLYPNYRQPPLTMVRGQGCLLWDHTGKRYLDFYAGIAVSCLGHNHPALTAAIAEQAAKVIHLSNYFYNEPNIRLAGALSEATGMDRAFFCNSGTEAIEAMLKLARRYFYGSERPERTRIIACEQSFHGRTMGALAATGQPGYREGFGPLGPVTHVPYGNVNAVRAALGEDTAAVLVEPVQGEGGVVPAPPGYLSELRALTEQHGVLMLVDEIQTGVGRTGRFLACEHDDVRPDAIALAKGLAGGVPIGAMVCRESLAGALPPGSHGTTFGGNPLASAAALAVLDTLKRDGLVERAELAGERLGTRLRQLAEKHAKVAAGARGRGLMQALVLRDGVDVRGLVGTLREHGLLVTAAGGVALRLTPPLVIGDELIDEGCAIIDDVLGAAA